MTISTKEKDSFLLKVVQMFGLVNPRRAGRGGRGAPI
jgi:hypothetical protein